METNNGKQGGLLKGDAHSDPSGGIKAIVVTDNNRPVLLENEEVIINKKSVQDPEVKTITGTNKEILSEINTEHGGVPILEAGGDVSPFKDFIEIVKKSKSVDDAYAKIKSIKNVPHHTAVKFRETYDPNENLSPRQSFEKFYNEVKMADGGTIEEKITTRLQERQKGKEFKDTGTVTYTRKYRAAYDIITLDDLQEIEKDNVSAYKLIEKSKIWPLYNVAELKEQGNTSGAAYLKVEARAFCSARPLDTPAAREVYVRNVTKLRGRLELAKTANMVRSHLEEFINLETFDFGDTSSLPPSMYTSTSYTGNLAKHSKRHVEKYFDDIFGKKFYNFCKVSSDPARKIFAAAFLYEPFSLESRNNIIETRYAKSQQRVVDFTALLEKIKNTEDERSALKKVVEDSGIQYYPYSYNKDALIKEVGQKLAVNQEATKDQIEKGLTAMYTVREEDWSWSESKEKKAVDPKDSEGKPRKPQSIFEKYGIEEPKVLKRTPLDFIKRVGGLAVGDISTKSVLDNYGFKNIIYGNYVNDSESKEHTKHFLGAMVDLMEITNINIKDVNRLGGLDINIGATGCGAFSPAFACYFPSLKAINVTKKRGDGSIAHEWAHYLDNVLAEGQEKKATKVTWATDEKQDTVLKSERVKLLMAEYKNWLMTGGKQQTVNVVYYPQSKFRYMLHGNTAGEVIDNVQKRYPIYKNYKGYQTNDLIKYYGYVAYKLNDNKPIEVPLQSTATNYWINSSKFSPYDYFTDPQELFARAFESWIEHKLKKANRWNNYLVDVAAGMGLAALVLPRSEWCYPEGAEMEWLSDWFERLLSAIRVDYSIAPFEWSTTERVDEYTEFKKEATEKIDTSVTVKGDEVIVNGDVEEFEKGYGFRQESLKDAKGINRIIYRLLTDPHGRGKGMALGGDRSEVFICALKNFSTEKKGYGVANGLVNNLPVFAQIFTDKNLDQVKHEAVAFFKSVEAGTKTTTSVPDWHPVPSSKELLEASAAPDIQEVKISELDEEIKRLEEKFPNMDAATKQILIDALQKAASANKIMKCGGPIDGNPSPCENNTKNNKMDLGTHDIVIGKTITDEKSNINYQISDINAKGIFYKPAHGIWKSDETQHLTFDEFGDKFAIGSISIEGYEKTQHDIKILQLVLANLKKNYDNYELGGKLKAREEQDKANEIARQKRKRFAKAMELAGEDDEMEKGGSVSQDRLDEVFTHYIAAALWSSTDDEGNNFDAEYSIHDLDQWNEGNVKDRVRQFLVENESDLDASGLSNEQIGHDLWLTQVGHGAGFWDRGLDKELGERLSKSAKKLGESANVYAENGRLFIDGLNYDQGDDKMGDGGQLDINGDEYKDPIKVGRYKMGDENVYGETGGGIALKDEVCLFYEKNDSILKCISPKQLALYIEQGKLVPIPPNAMEKGGAIPNNYEGKNYIQVWDAWTKDQRLHFITDHTGKQHTPSTQEALVKKEYQYLPYDFKVLLAKHIETGQYAKGGKIKGNKNIWYGGKRNEKVYKAMLEEAKENKEWATKKEKEVGRDWPGASEISREMLHGYLDDSLEDIAKEHYNYLRLRSHATGSVYGQPQFIDNPAKDKWERLSGEKIQLNDVKEKGGPISNSYSGKSAEQVWNDWDKKQRQHFIADHIEKIRVALGESKQRTKKPIHEYAKSPFLELPPAFIGILETHVNSGEYEKGGNINNADKFEVGTPAVYHSFNYDGKPREQSGEIVMNRIAMWDKNRTKLYEAGTLKGISLYRDANYSGPEERFIVPNWKNVEKFAEANERNRAGNKFKISKEEYGKGGGIGKNTEYYISKDRNDNKPGETIYSSKVFNKQEIQNKFDEEAKKLNVGESLEYGKMDDHEISPNMLLVEMKPSGLVVYTASGHTKKYTPKMGKGRSINKPTITKYKEYIIETFNSGKDNGFDSYLYKLDGELVGVNVGGDESTSIEKSKKRVDAKDFKPAGFGGSTSIKSGSFEKGGSVKTAKRGRPFGSKDKIKAGKRGRPVGSKTKKQIA